MENGRALKRGELGVRSLYARDQLEREACFRLLYGFQGYEERVRLGLQKARELMSPEELEADNLAFKEMLRLHSRLLDKPDPEDDSGRKWMESHADEVAQSPVGKLTAAWIKFIPPEFGNGAEDLDADVSELHPEAPAADVAISPKPELPPDDTNEYMRKLVWPPQQTKIDEPVDDGIKHRWVKAEPSSPSKDQQPLPPDDFDNRTLC